MEQHVLIEGTFVISMTTATACRAPAEATKDNIDYMTNQIKERL